MYILLHERGAGKHGTSDKMIPNVWREDIFYVSKIQVGSYKIRSVLCIYVLNYTKQCLTYKNYIRYASI